MPTYEYRCPDGHDFERFYRKISDATSEVSCPVCGKTAERILSKGAGFSFKGSGFYLTDYGKNAHRSSGPAAKPEGSGESGSGDSAATPAASKEGSSDSGTPSTGDAKPASDAKAASDAKPAAAAKAAPESKPAPSGGSSSSKDK
jgi:putative FmdB family regulatory protein